MALYLVKASQLNLRSTPAVGNNIVAALPEGQSVTDLDQSKAPWWKIRTTFHNVVLEGFAHSDFLQLASTAPPLPTVSTISPVHLGPSASARPGSASNRANPIGDSAAPVRGGANQTAELASIISYLDVERGLRYQPTTTSTYCNIYAYDYCYLARVFLPRVWWTGPALQELTQGQHVNVQYGVTVNEVNANGLFDWLNSFGPRFGWRRVFDLDVLQAHANNGGVGFICAQRKELNRSGHIVAVVPETAAQTAFRSGGKVVRPLQSQAGARNFRYTNGPRAWWQGSEFREFGLFLVD